MLIAAIAIILLVVGGVSVMYTVMQENAKVADEVVVVSAHSNERIKEEVEITRDPSDPQQMKLHNKGPEIGILEYRVLDDDGTLLLSCSVNHEVGASQKEIIDATDLAFKTCWEEYHLP